MIGHGDTKKQRERNSVSREEFLRLPERVRRSDAMQVLGVGGRTFSKLVRQVPALVTRLPGETRAKYRKAELERLLAGR